mmetsp:Transcript_155128/g.285796  ORF Transcript_155128/g.285796 Transcript_155128/m.285796 type:complete len:141 (-) Transcript_155128:59-481(-)
MQLIMDSGYTLEKVATAVQNTFKRIAVTYSPHRPATIRHSELDEFLRHCRYRSTLANLAAPTQSQGKPRRTAEQEAAARRRSMDMAVGRLDSEQPLRETRARSMNRKQSDESPQKRSPVMKRQPTLINLIPADESRPLLQ